MSVNYFQDIIKSTIEALDPISEESLEALSILIPESIIVASFDILDRGKVLKLTTTWGRFFFHVVGSSETYPVLIDLPSPMFVYCGCPAFMYNVLINNNQNLCKHALAVFLAQKLGKYTERTATVEEIASSIFTENQGDD